MSEWFKALLTMRFAPCFDSEFHHWRRLADDIPSIVIHFSIIIESSFLYSTSERDFVVSSIRLVRDLGQHRLLDSLDHRQRDRFGASYLGTNSCQTGRLSSPSPSQRRYLWSAFQWGNSLRMEGVCDLPTVTVRYLVLEYSKLLVFTCLSSCMDCLIYLPTCYV